MQIRRPYVSTLHSSGKSLLVRDHKWNLKQGAQFSTKSAGKWGTFWVGFGSAPKTGFCGSGLGEINIYSSLRDNPRPRFIFKCYSASLTIAFFRVGQRNRKLELISDIDEDEIAP